MSDRLADYRKADAPIPTHNRLWPLYGGGFENLGRDGDMIERPHARLWTRRIAGAARRHRHLFFRH